MGVDFTATFDRHLSREERYILPERLNTSWKLPAPLGPWVRTYVRAGSSQWKWERKTPFVNAGGDLFEEPSVLLNGPDGFHARVYKHGIELIHLARWWSFVYEFDVQVGLQAACRIIASIAGAEHILYLPDSRFPPSAAYDVLSQGGTVSDMLGWLHSNVGAPLADPAVFLGRGDDEFDERSWFYERANPPLQPTAEKRGG